MTNYGIHKSVTNKLKKLAMLCPWKIGPGLHVLCPKQEALNPSSLPMGCISMSALFIRAPLPRARSFS